MGFENMKRFSADLRQHAGVDTSLRRMGDDLVLRVGDSEFFFDRDGRYTGSGDGLHSRLADLVVDLDVQHDGASPVEHTDAARPERASSSAGSTGEAAQ